VAAVVLAAGAGVRGAGGGSAGGFAAGGATGVSGGSAGTLAVRTRVEPSSPSCDATGGTYVRLEGRARKSRTSTIDQRWAGSRTMVPSSSGVIQPASDSRGGSSWTIR